MIKQSFTFDKNKFVQFCVASFGDEGCRQFSYMDFEPTGFLFDVHRSTGAEGKLLVATFYDTRREKLVTINELEVTIQQFEEFFGNSAEKLFTKFADWLEASFFTYNFFMVDEPIIKDVLIYTGNLLVDCITKCLKDDKGGKKE